MPSVARIGDMWVGICCCHPPIPCIGMSGTIITGSGNAKSGGPSVGRLTDIVIGFCGHPGTIVSASGKNFTNALGKARVGDAVTGCTIGTIITGNPTHTTS